LCVVLFSTICTACPMHVIRLDLVTLLILSD
jgi:hypothetical protein